MKTMIINYLFEGSLWMLGALSFYYLLKNRVSLNFRRFFLLATAILPWILPLVKFQSAFITLPIEGITIEEVSVTGSSRKPYFPDLLFTSYLVGVFVMSIRMIMGLVKLYTRKKQFSLISRSAELSIYHTHGLMHDSSFFRAIFLDNSRQRTPKEEALIIKHEQGHIREGHSWDRILIEVLLIFGWFHPLMYLIKKELTSVHEYLADKHALGDSDQNVYRSLLLREAFETSISFANNFHSKDIKNRFAELQRKYVPLSPIFLFVLIAGLIFFGKSFHTQKEAYPEIEEMVMASEQAIPLNMRAVKNAIGYPQVARDKGIEGMVVLRILVDKKGNIQDYKTIVAESPLLEEAVIAHIAELQFKPGRTDGKPIAMWVNIPFNFKLVP